MQLAEELYRSTAVFPSEEKYGLTSQIRRCAVSLPSNIAEGHASGFTRIYLRHVAIVLGSLAEFETQVLLAERLSYAPSDATREISESCRRLGRTLVNLRKSLRARERRAANEE